MTKLCRVVSGGRGGAEEEKGGAGVRTGVRKVKRMAYSAGTCEMPTPGCLPVAICVSVQGKKNLSICSPLSLAPAGPRIDFETSMLHCSRARLDITDTYGYMEDERGAWVGGWLAGEPNLESDPQSSLSV